MSFPVSPRKKPTSLPARGSRRDPAAVTYAMSGAAGGIPTGKRKTSPDCHLLDPRNHTVVGLPFCNQCGVRELTENAKIKFLIRCESLATCGVVA